MRLCTDPVATIRQEVLNLAGDSARVWLFSSRMHDEARGSDVDLLIEVDEPVMEPALLSARLSAHVSRIMHVSKVNVLVLFSVRVNSSYFLYQIGLQPPWNLRRQLFICDRFNLKADHAATGFAELGGAAVLSA